MLPQFLVIGAQKSGTTWLDRNLRIHPEIWLPPEKEIHYFDFPPLIPFYYLLLAPDRSIRNWAKNRILRDYRKVQANEQTLTWFMRYYFSWRTQNWYSSLFTPNPQQIAGEATPRYAILSTRKVAKIHALMPDCKIIYLLRDPIDRMWSDLAMHYSAKFGNEGLSAADEQRIVDFLTKSRHLASSRYTDNLKRWETFYPSSQIFIGFQEQIRDTPRKLIESVYQFLGVDASEQLVAKIQTRKINSHEYPAIPKHIAFMLAELLIDEIEKLHQRFDNVYTAEWLAKAQGYLAAGKA